MIGKLTGHIVQLYCETHLSMASCIQVYGALSAKSLALIIARSRWVSGHLVQASFQSPAIRLGYVTKMHWPRRPGKTPYRTRQGYFVSRLSSLAARPSLEPRPLQVFILFFCCSTDRPTITRDGAMENETFFGMAIQKELASWRKVSLPSTASEIGRLIRSHFPLIEQHFNQCIVVYDVDEEGRFSQKYFWRENVIAVVILLRVLARIW